MVVNVHPLNYVLQIVFFVWSAVILGFSIYALQKETKLDGWILSPRVIACSNLVFSAAWDVLRNFDTHSFLGIYSQPWVRFIEFFQSTLIVAAGSCAVYLYLMFLYKQHLASVPPWLTNVWVIFNCAANILVFITAIIGTSTDNSFWHGIASWIVLAHEITFLICLTISLFLILRVVKRLQSQSQIKSIDFTSTTRKIWILQITITLLVLISFINQFTVEIDLLLDLPWGAPIHPYVNPEEFREVDWILGVLFCAGHTVLLFILRRPSSKEQVVCRIETTSEV